MLKINYVVDWFIQEKCMPNMKRHWKVMQSQSTTKEQSHIYMSQQYRCDIMIEVKWEDLRQKNSPRDIFTCFDH